MRPLAERYSEPKPSGDATLDEFRLLRQRVQVQLAALGLARRRIDKIGRAMGRQRTRRLQGCPWPTATLDRFVSRS